MEFEEDIPRLIISLKLPSHISDRTNVQPRPAKKKVVKKGEGLRAKTKDWLRRNHGKWLASEIVKGLEAEGYEYRGTGKWGSIKIQMTNKLSEFIRKKDPNIGRDGNTKKFRYFYLHDEISSSDEEDEVIVPMDIDDIIEKHHGVNLGSDDGESSSDEDEEEVLGKRKRFGGKQTRFTRYQDTGEVGEFNLYGGCAGFGSLESYQQEPANFMQEEPLYQDMEPRAKRRKRVHFEEEEIEMTPTQSCCNHFYQRQGMHLFCRYCAHVVKNRF